MTTDPAALAQADFIIVAVPTPVDEAHQPDLTPLVGRERIGRAAHEARRDRRLRIDGLSGRHRGSVHTRPGEILGHAVEEGFPRRLFARAHQSRRPGAHADEDTEGGLGRRRGNAGEGRGALREHRHRRRAPRVQHQGRRGRQGDREHAARPQHRAHERARHPVRPDRHRHARGAAGRRHQVELPAVPARAWSAGTASASIRTTSPTRPTRSAITRR